MQRDELLEAIERYLAGDATAAQRKLVNDWYHSFDDELVTVETADVAYEELLYARLRLRLAESTGVFVRGKNEVKRVRLWPKIRIAIGTAAAVTAVVFGLWFFNADRHSDSPSSRTAGRDLLNDIAPGKNGATITLANGKVIELDSAKSGVVVGGKAGLVYDDSTHVISNEVRDLSYRRDDGDSKVQNLTASTVRGQTYQFTLPDGTKVWLNADSKLEFPTSFANSNARNVKLIGEGYFEVATSYTSLRGSRTKQSFIVEARRQKVEVLGTHFNVSAYVNDIEVKTTLLEGRVAVTEEGSRLTLHPGDQAYSGLDGIRARTLVNPEAEIDWKNGKFIFDNADLRQIMKKVSRWYNLDVVYEGKASERTFNGLIKRDVNLSQILKVLKLGGIKFRIEEHVKAGGAKRIVVME